MDQTEDDPVALHRAGTTHPEKLNVLIAQAWSAAMDDRHDRSEIEAILKTTDQELQGFPPPFRAEVGEAGLTGAEIAIFFAAPFLTAYAEKLGGRAADLTLQQAKKLWLVLREKMSYSEPEALGPEIESSGQ